MSYFNVIDQYESTPPPRFIVMISVLSGFTDENA
jgi:hypothetical protein